MTFRDLRDLVKATAAGWVADYAQSMGAALAFYTMFSIAPLLLIVIGLWSVLRPQRGDRRASRRADPGS